MSLYPSLPALTLLLQLLMLILTPLDVRSLAVLQNPAIPTPHHRSDYAFSVTRQLGNTLTSAEPESTSSASSEPVQLDDLEHPANVPVKITAKTEMVTGRETDDESESDAVTELLIESGTKTEAERETKTATDATKETIESAPKSLVTSKAATPLPQRCLCCNTSIGNLSITISGTDMRITGSAPEIDLTLIAARCPEATSLTIRVGAKNVTGHGVSLWRVTHLDLSRNQLTAVPESVLKMTALKSINLAGNRISRLPQRKLQKMFTSLVAVDVTGNPLRCSRALTWLEGVSALQRWRELTCVGGRRGPFGNDQKPLGEVIGEIRRVDAECPVGCRCQLENLLPTQLAVGCDARQLLQLPARLPRGVTSLNASGNQIRSVELCRLLTSYPTLSTVDLSHNHLTSVTPGDLRCAGRLGLLDLRYNQLSRLDWKELERALGSGSLRAIFLSHNRWDCHHEEETMEFWRFLVSHWGAVLDAADILCAREFGVHGGKTVLTLRPEEVWRGWWEVNIDLIDVIIIMEVLLILLVGGKFTWDVYSYRRTGRLPWPCQLEWSCAQLSRRACFRGFNAR